MDANHPLTSKQRDTLQFIREMFADKGHAPTLQEIADNFGISKVSAFERCDQLIARGLVRRAAKGASRGLIPADRCPCCGQPNTILKVSAA